MSENNDNSYQLDSQKEEWRDVAGYEGLYQVSNFGNVKRVALIPKYRYGCFLTPTPTHKGYIEVTFCKGHPVQQKSFRIHQLVMRTFGSAPPFDKAEVNHKNGCKTDNRIDNLEWMTTKENVNHSFKVLGRQPNHLRGEDHFHKLTDEDVKIIRQMFADGNSISEITKYFAVARRTISDVIHRKTWTHI